MAVKKVTAVKAMPPWMQKKEGKESPMQEKKEMPMKGKKGCK